MKQNNNYFSVLRGSLEAGTVQYPLNPFALNYLLKGQDSLYLYL